jgi:hypothetical protein
MNKPSDEQIKIALGAAQRMREHVTDPHYLAQVLLYLKARNEALEALLVQADRLVRFGLAETELSQLTRQVQRLRESDGESPTDGVDKTLPI